MADRGSAGRRPDPAANDADAERSTSFDVQKTLETVGLVAAPAALVTAILYWFGLELTGGRAGYFGLTTGTLGLSTTDYLVRGTEAGIVPLVVLFVVVLVAVVVHLAISRLAVSRGGATWFRRGLVGALVLATGLLGVGTSGVFVALPAPFDGYLLPAALLSVSPILALYLVALIRGRPEPTSEGWFRIAGVAAVALSVLGVFWATSLYADALGRGRAQQLAGNLAAQPRVIVYSERSLALDPATVSTQRLPVSDQERFTYRYSGLRLLLQSDVRYFLVPDSWTRTSGTVIVLTESPDVRVEFAPGG